MAAQPLSVAALAANRRGIGFAYALMALVVMLLLGLTFLQIGMTARHNAYSHKGDTQAFMLAEAAVDHAVWLMSGFSDGDATHDDIDLALGSGTLGAPATYESTAYELNRGRYFFGVTHPHGGMQDAALIEASGISRTGEQERIRVVARYLHEDAVSPVFGHALFSDHNMTLTGNLTIDGQPDQGGGGVHANGNVSIVGNPTVIGNVSATGTVSPVGNVHISEGEVRPFSEYIAMPEIEADWYRDHASESYTGSATFNGNLCDAGTVEIPKIIFVDGTCKINGNITGVGTIVCTGDVTINGNALYSSPSSLMAVISLGKVKINGNCHVNGLIYAHNVDNTATILVNGNSSILGAVVGDTLTGNGNMNVTFDPNLRNLRPLPGFDGARQVDILSWERI